MSSSKSSPNTTSLAESVLSVPKLLGVRSHSSCEPLHTAAAALVSCTASAMASEYSGTALGSFGVTVPVGVSTAAAPGHPEASKSGHCEAQAGSLTSVHSSHAKVTPIDTLLD